MDRDPGDFPAYKPAKPVSGMSDDELDAWLQTLPPAPGILHIDDPDTSSDERALADFEAGRFHDHATVTRWLRTCGDSTRLSFKDWLAAHDG